MDVSAGMPVLERSEVVGEGDEGPTVGLHIEGAGAIGRREKRTLRGAFDFFGDGRVGGGSGVGFIGDGG